MKAGTLIVSLLVLSLAFSLNLMAQQQKWQEVPDDYNGLLVKSDITAITRAGELEISVTVMDESILRYATLELKDYLNSIKKEYLSDGRYGDPLDPKSPIPFLVNFRALGQEIRYEPHEFAIYNLGSEIKPLEIIPISPKFMDKVAYIRQPPVAAIYLFERGMDLQSRDLIFSYFDSVRFGNWQKVIERLNAARTQYELDRARK